MSNIYKITKDFRIIRLTDIDAKRLSDYIVHFKDLVLSHEVMYPKIDKWYTKKVVPGLVTSERVGFIGYLNDKPVASAIVKKGENSKFCHLNLREDIQDENLGEVFFALMAQEVRNIAKEIHFTLPESIWEKEKYFFKSFGFLQAVKAKAQYRLFDEELRCSTSFKHVWQAVLSKSNKLAKKYSVGGYSLDNNLILSIHPEYAKKIISGEKIVELRKKFAKKWSGSKVSLYATRPESALIGEARIKEIIVDHPEQIWYKYSNEIGTTKKEYDNYVAESNVIYALILDQIKPYKNSIPLSQLSHLIKKDLKPPQSYFSLDNNKIWSEAIYISAMIHGITESPLNILNQQYEIKPKTKKLQKTSNQLTLL